MKRTPLQRKTPLQGRSAIKRQGRVTPKRATARRREAPRWTRDNWLVADIVLKVRSRGRCERCDADLVTTGVERHHRKRRRDGGDRHANLAMLCPPCHQWVTVHPAESRRQGWIVAVAADPTEVPMRTPAGWAWLDDDGLASLDRSIADGADAHALP